MKTRLTDDARAQVDTIDAWWRENRRDSPHLFTAEFRGALRRISLLPRMGLVYSEDELGVVYRVLLRRTRHLVYYEVIGEVAWIVCVWGAPKDGPPQLSTPPV